ncbi:MAG: adenosylmethionine decarboxylase, partial [Smithellaceae bacterium]|nr:adenosylmethionine decarboxylase [Smithellaceae bacterium]
MHTEGHNSPTLPNSAPDGIHHLIEFFGCCPQQINSQNFWETILDSALEGADVQILNRHFYAFAPHGVTGYFLLSASHISVHTWPENGYVACDVFSCGDEDETSLIVQRITAAIRHERTRVTSLHRGYRFGADSDATPLLPIEAMVHCEQQKVCPALNDARMNHFDITCANGDILRIPVTGLLHKTRSSYQEITVCATARFGRCLLLDGIIQTAESDHEKYDRAILHMLRPSDRSLLILGGGDGYAAAQALEINPALHVTVVELDGAVVAAARDHLGQMVFDDLRIDLVVEDAFTFLPRIGSAAFDGVVCDLTDFPVGYDQVQGAEFYSRIFSASNAALKPRGWIAIYAGATDMMLDGGGRVVERLRGLLAESFGKVECSEVFVPSFGEPCCYLYGEKVIGESGKLKVEVLKEATDDIVNQIVGLGKITFPVASNGDNISDYYADLNNQDYINIVLKRRDEIVGYLLAVPQHDACSYQKDSDPLMIERSDMFYVDAIQIIPGASNAIGFIILLKKLFEEAGNSGINKFSMHARKANGLSRLILKLFPKTRSLRSLPNFEGTGEVFEYIETELT